MHAYVAAAAAAAAVMAAVALAFAFAVVLAPALWARQHLVCGLHARSRVQAQASPPGRVGVHGMACTALKYCRRRTTHLMNTRHGFCCSIRGGWRANATSTLSTIDCINPPIPIQGACMARALRTLISIILAWAFSLLDALSGWCFMASFFHAAMSAAEQAALGGPMLGGGRFM